MINLSTQNKVLRRSSRKLNYSFLCILILLISGLVLLITFIIYRSHRKQPIEELAKTNFRRFQLKANIKWKKHGETIVGGNGRGHKLSQLNEPDGIYVDNQQKSIYITDRGNHRCIIWKNTAETMTEGCGQGKKINQLNEPTDLVVDQRNKSLIICDWKNRRVVRWSLENPLDKQILIKDIECQGLMMNDKGDLFVSDHERDEVKKWKRGEKEGIIVAGGNGRGHQLNQFNGPTYIFVDRQETIYVSDYYNHRVMKWFKGAKEGIVAAGGHGYGNGSKHLSGPNGLIANEVGDVFVADSENQRIMYWPSGSKEGHVVLGGNGHGTESNQFNWPMGLSFDSKNNLYVSDYYNHRIQRFSVDEK